MAKKKRLELQFSGEHWEIRVGDVLARLAEIPDKSIHVVITSPPYWMLRDYGFRGQIGMEDTPEEFVAILVKVFAEVRRVLRDDGLLFLNMGDTLAGGRRKRGANLPDGSVIGIPWKTAFALQADGWILRSETIWLNPSKMPETISGWRWTKCRKKISKGTADAAAIYEPCVGCSKCKPNEGLVLKKGSWRPSRGHEQVFIFSKSIQFYADGDSSKEPTTGGANHRGKGVNPKAAMTNVIGECRELKSKANNSFSANCSGLVETRNLRSVWSIVPEGFKGKHFATFPLELVRRCISIATARGGACSKCGTQLAPIVESERIPTRPGQTTKIEGEGRETIGNRDPKRHTTLASVKGFRPVCKCSADIARPIVLDCFAGASTTGRVAINMGCDFIGLEGSEEYAKMGSEEIVRPWEPKSKTKKTKRQKRAVVKKLFNQLLLKLELAD